MDIQLLSGLIFQGENKGLHVLKIELGSYVAQWGHGNNITVNLTN
jgi:hypothetical protein